MVLDESDGYVALDDTELALKLKDGDEKAFDELVRRFQGRVYATAYRFMLNREDALDVAQDALVKVYRNIHAWQPTGGFLAWLLRLTSNQAIDSLRRRKRERHQHLDEAFLGSSEHAPIEPTALSTEQQVRANEIDERIQAGLIVLSDMQRTVFMLRHYEGFQLADIAADLGCTVGSVKVHLFRALQKLRKELADLHEVRI